MKNEHINKFLETRRALEQEAKKEAMLNGHDIHRFSPDDSTPLKSRSHCRRCGAAAYTDAWTEQTSGTALNQPCRR